MDEPQPEQGWRPRWLPFSEVRKKWSFWVAAFWSATGAFVMVGAAYLYSNWNWWIGAAVFAAASSIGVARWLKQPGTEQ